jgi:predicted transcriptional regulator
MNKPDHFSEVVSEFVDDFVVGVTRMGKLFTRVTLALSAKEKEEELKNARSRKDEETDGTA